MLQSILSLLFYFFNAFLILLGQFTFKQILVTS